MQKIKFLLLLLAFTSTAASGRPKLTVNIVVSGLKASDIERYGENFGQGGFKRLIDNGTTFTECYVDYAQTSSEAGAATLASGTNPSTHGIIGKAWYDRTTSQQIEVVTRKPNGNNFYYFGVSDKYSTENIIAQTLTEAALAAEADSHVITIAHTPSSAILTSGQKGECYWLDNKNNWSSGDCYTKSLPKWVAAYNSDEYNRIYEGFRWFSKYPKAKYRNTRSTILTPYEGKSSKGGTATYAIASLTESPIGNLALFEFAKRAITDLDFNANKGGIKMLNLYLDTPRMVAEKFGSDSVEYEDVLYCLDDTLAEFLTFLGGQTKLPEDVLITLTSDHGMSPWQDGGENSDRFNTRQFEVITNAFISARYGQANWVVGYHDGSLFLNHETIYSHHKSVGEIQQEVATFALQFRSVAYAVTASAMQSTYFGGGIMYLMQNGFYPRRSGDVIIALMPGRIEERNNKYSLSGSPYEYDRHVPMIFYGGGVGKQTISRKIDITTFAPTVARILGIERPSASQAEIISEIIK